MGIWAPSNTWFLGSTPVHIPNRISIGSAVLQGSRLRQTDRQTDLATPSAVTGCIYVRSAAMRPKSIAVSIAIMQYQQPLNLSLLCVLIKLALQA